MTCLQQIVGKINANLHNVDRACEVPERVPTVKAPTQEPAGGVTLPAVGVPLDIFFQRGDQTIHVTMEIGIRADGHAIPVDKFL
jgi:hypothetical protein